MRKLQLNEFYKYKFLSGFNYSPNGNKAAFVMRTTDEKDNKYLSNIWLYDSQGMRRLTGLDAESSFIFEDDNHILFPAVRDDADRRMKEANDVFTSFYRLSLDGGEAQKAFTIPLEVLSIQILIDDLYVIVANCDALHPDFYQYDEEKRNAVKEEEKENADYEILDDLPWWSNGVGFTNKMRHRLFLYNSKINKCTPITDAFFQVNSVDVSFDKKTLLYTGAEVKDKEKQTIGVYHYNIAEMKETTIVEDGKYNVRCAYFFNKGYIISMNDGANKGNSQNGDFYILDKDGTVLEKIPYDNSLGGSVGSDVRFGSNRVAKAVANRFYFITTIRNSSHLYCICNGQIEKIIEKEGSIDGFDVCGGNILFIGLYDMQLQEIYHYNLVSKEFNQLSTMNQDVLKGVYVARPNRLQVASRDTEIDGWVLEPEIVDEDKKYPAILNIHGGPKSVYGEVFYHEMQYWANEGYYVFFCNPVGSDGRGNEFMDIFGKYGTIDYEDIMNFTDAVLKEYPQIDENKLAVTGGSYGGYMTNWIIGHTDRFAAAASQRSIANWISFYGNSDIGTSFTKDQHKVNDIYEGAEKLWWHSPLKYANQVSTPTLFIHSDEDYRCWIPEGLQMYTALKDRGIPARLCWFKGENHELSRAGKPTHRAKRLKEITEWITEHLSNVENRVISKEEIPVYTNGYAVNDTNPAINEINPATYDANRVIDENNPIASDTSQMASDASQIINENDYFINPDEE